jgi:hypothetical protein
MEAWESPEASISEGTKAVKVRIASPYCRRLVMSHVLALPLTNRRQARNTATPNTATSTLCTVSCLYSPTNVSLRLHFPDCGPLCDVACMQQCHH